MATTLRPELSEKNEYWISKHRYYELKHFCLQYPFWKKVLRELDGYSKESASSVDSYGEANLSNPTADFAEERERFRKRIDILEQTAERTDETIGKYILKGVTTGMSYDILKSKLDIPCCKDTYYELYRKFFWLLDIVRE